MNTIVKFSDLIGKTFTSVVKSEDATEIVFTTDDGDKYRQFHSQDCCESVYVEDICGDLEDLVGSPIIEAEESSNHADNNGKYESVTWTFYKLATMKGPVIIRWCGSSDGYYSESVDLEKL